jgi:L-asparagine transporter-like permease
MWLFPWASYVAVAAIVGILAAMAFIPSSFAQFAASMGVLAIALLAFLLLRRGRAGPA